VSPRADSSCSLDILNSDLRVKEESDSLVIKLFRALVKNETLRKSQTSLYGFQDPDMDLKHFLVEASEKILKIVDFRVELSLTRTAWMTQFDSFFFVIFSLLLV